MARESLMYLKHTAHSASVTITSLNLGTWHGCGKCRQHDVQYLMPIGSMVHDSRHAASVPEAGPYLRECPVEATAPVG